MAPVDTRGRATLVAPSSSSFPLQELFNIAEAGESLYYSSTVFRYTITLKISEVALSMNARFVITTLSAIAIVGCSTGQKGTAPSEATKSGSEISTAEQREFIERQKEEMRKQERELQDLRRQKFHDDYFRSQYQK